MNDVPTRSRLARIGFGVAAVVLFIIGAVGLVAPIIPGIVFLVLATTLLARSSDRFDRWLRRRRWYQRLRGKGDDVR